jgi:hypothetical protein
MKDQPVQPSTEQCLGWVRGCWPVDDGGVMMAMVLVMVLVMVLLRAQIVRRTVF